MAKKFFTDESLATFVNETKTYTDNAVAQKSQVQIIESNNSEVLPTLKIHKMTQEEYEHEVENGTVDENALYLTPEEDIDLSGYATVEQLNEKANVSHNHDDMYYTETEIDNLIINHAHDSLYDAKGSANIALEESKTYTNNAVAELSSTVVYVSDSNENISTETDGILASEVNYVNTTSRLSSTNVQAAIDELSEETSQLSSEINKELEKIKNYSVTESIVNNKIETSKRELIGNVDDSSDTDTINGAKVYTREMLIGVASEEYVDEQFNQLSELKADKTAISTPYTFKGTTTFSALPTANNTVNDTYFCTDKNCKYTWSGTGWYQSSLIETQYVDRLNYIDEELSNFISNISEYDEQLFELDKWINGSLYYDSSTTVWNNMSAWRRYPAFDLEAGTYFVANIHASFFNLKFADGTIVSLTNYDNWVPFSTNGEAIHVNGYFVIDQTVTVYASTNKWNKTMLSRKRIPDNIGYVEGVYALKLRPDVVNYSLNDIKIENILLGNIETMDARNCGTFSGYPITFVQTHTGSGNRWWEIGFDASKSKRGFIRVDINISTMSGAAKLYLFGNSTSGSSLIIPVQDIKETGRHIMDIDLNFYVVYHDLVLDNNIRVGIANHTDEFSCTYDKINVYDLSTDLDTDKNLNDNLSDMMIQIQSNTNNINSLKERSSATILVAPNGEKYIIQVGENGAVTSTPKIPKNILYIGNSLLIGWGTFGMAASNSSSDYYYYVNQYLQGLGVNLTTNKLKGIDFEGCTSSAEQATWYNDTLLPTLNNDVDLVIIQLGDNVNTAEKLAVFEQGAKDLVTFVRTNAPRARVAWVGEWYSSTAKQTYIANACAERGADFIDISDLPKVSGYCANIGDVVTKDDGTTVTIDSSGVASHPSSKGMKAVADRIINALFK